MNTPLTNLDAYAANMMAHYQETSDAHGMRDVAYLMCDVALGLPDPGIESWKAMTTDPALRYRVVFDAMRALWDKDAFEDALELSQRFKSVGFAWPSIQRLKSTGAPHVEARGYLQALNSLAATVEDLQGPARRDSQQRAERVRAAGEALMEAGEYLRDRDAILHARLGGLIRRPELIDVFSVADPVAIVDLNITHDGTLIHVLARAGNDVVLNPIQVVPFTVERAGELLPIWSEGNVSNELSPRQLRAVAAISSKLHQYLFCALARQLAEWRLPQVVLIPDLFTRNLPLHLAGICGKELKALDQKTKDARFFCDAFPVEYAPCLQAVAVSQHQRRPKQISGAFSLADARGNLPGARMTSAWLKTQSKGDRRVVEKVGEKADRKALTEGIEKAHIVVIGTHGHFDPRDPENSYIELADARWTMAEMIDRPFFAHSPLLILSACEVGAVAASPDDREASGIPGALVSAGAACVIANLWPAEDVSMGLVMQFFLRTLGHRGYRPAAVLFRATRELRRLSRAQALAHCDELLALMRADGTRAAHPEQYLRVDNLAAWIDEHGGKRPFESPWFWGGLVAVGSGWGAPAGALIGGAEVIQRIAKATMTREHASELIRAGKAREARDAVRPLLDFADGIERVRTLELLAWAVWRARSPHGVASAKGESIALLDQAEQLASAEEDEQLLRNIAATRKKIDLEVG